MQVKFLVYEVLLVISSCIVRDNRFDSLTMFNFVKNKMNNGHPTAEVRMDLLFSATQ